MYVRKEMCAKKYVSWRSSEALSCKLDIQPWKGWLLHFTLEHWNVHNIYLSSVWIEIYICIYQKKRAFNPLVFWGTIFMKYGVTYRYWLLTQDHGVTMSRWYFQIFWLSSLNLSKFTVLPFMYWSTWPFFSPSELHVIVSWLNFGDPENLGELEQEHWICGE